MDDWNNQIVSIVGASFDGLTFNGTTSPMITGSLTDGIILMLQKSRMVQIQGGKGEAVVLSTANP
jgi:hypothetical protein